MANKIGRIVIGIVVVVALVVGIYYILPGQYKNPIKATIQSKTISSYNDIVDTVSGCTVPNNKDKTFGDMMTSATGNPAWTIEEVSVDDAGNGAYNVYADGYKTTVSFENETNDDGMVTHTDAHVRIIFKVTKEGSDIKIKNKVLETGKQATPEEVQVDESSYKESDSSTYFQRTLDALCEM